MKNNFFMPNIKVYILILTVSISTFFILGHYYIGSLFLVFYVFFISYNIKISKTKTSEWKKFLEDFSSKMDVSMRTVLVNSPFPLVIVSMEGNILWYNQNFVDELEYKDILGKSVEQITNEISIDKIVNRHKRVFKQLKIGEKYYNIFVNINDSSAKSIKDNVILLYFYNVTKEVKINRERENKKDSIMLIEVDNLDDVLKTTETDKALLLSAEIERTIKNYAQSLEAMIIKYSSSKYAVVTYYENIKSEMEKNFDILDEVREINYGNKLAVTLSIGVGCLRETPMQNYEFATTAKELALSRGGDQVVIKINDKLQFFGGKTKEVEKRTKVRARVIAHALVNLINESSNVYIMGHSNPDIDSLGAAIGIHSVAKGLGKESHIILDKINSGIENPVERIRKRELYNQIFISRERCIATYDKNSLLILVDVNSKEYVQDKEILERIGKLVIIDHHRKSIDAIDGALLSYIEPYASSTCELVTEMLQYMLSNPKQHIGSLEAEMMMAGIYVDTKNFYFKTGVRTFEAAAYLRQLGADIIDVKKMFAGHLETYLKKAEIMSAAEVNNDIAIAICPPDIKDNVLAAQVADELLNITGVQASFVLAKIDNEVFISGRSFGDINVQVILEELGGGGHMTIAGSKIKDISIDEAKNQLKQAVDKYLGEGEE